MGKKSIFDIHLEKLKEKEKEPQRNSGVDVITYSIDDLAPLLLSRAEPHGFKMCSESSINWDGKVMAEVDILGKKYTVRNNSCLVVEKCGHVRVSRVEGDDKPLRDIYKDATNPKLLEFYNEHTQRNISRVFTHGELLRMDMLSLTSSNYRVDSYYGGGEVIVSDTYSMVGKIIKPNQSLVEYDDDQIDVVRTLELPEGLLEVEETEPVDEMEELRSTTLTAFEALIETCDENTLRAINTLLFNFITNGDNEDED